MSRDRIGRRLGSALFKRTDQLSNSQCQGSRPGGWDYVREGDFPLRRSGVRSRLCRNLHAIRIRDARFDFNPHVQRAVRRELVGGIGERAAAKPTRGKLDP